MRRSIVFTFYGCYTQAKLFTLTDLFQTYGPIKPETTIIQNPLTDQDFINSQPKPRNKRSIYNDYSDYDYEEYLATAGEYDTMNMLPRILRRNVFPMFLLTILLTTLIIYEYFGSWIVSKLLKGTIGNALKVVFAPFKKLWECCCAKALLVDKEYNPPFTKDFVRGYPKGEVVLLVN